jgi:hypothetical protein
LSHAHEHRAGQLLARASHPELLFWRAEPDPNQLRSAAVKTRDCFFVLLGSKYEPHGRTECVDYGGTCCREAFSRELRCARWPAEKSNSKILAARMADHRLGEQPAGD